MSLEGLLLRGVGAVILATIIVAPALDGDRSENPAAHGPLGWAIVGSAVTVMAVALTIGAGRWGWLRLLRLLKSVTWWWIAAALVGLVGAPIAGNADMIPAMTVWLAGGVLVRVLLRRIAEVLLPGFVSPLPPPSAAGERDKVSQARRSLRELPRDDPFSAALRDIVEVPPGERYWMALDAIDWRQRQLPGTAREECELGLVPTSHRLLVLRQGAAEVIDYRDCESFGYRKLGLQGIVTASSGAHSWEFSTHWAAAQALVELLNSLRTTRRGDSDSLPPELTT